jgi:hypothetical protein
MRALLALLVAGCGAAPADSGVTAWLRVAGAQFQPGAISDAAGGPAVAGVLADQTFIVRGSTGNALAGTLDAGATAAILALDGDSGYWIAVAGVPDVTAPDQPTLHADYDLSPLSPLGARDLTVRAVDDAGRAGAPTAAHLVVVDAVPPTGALVVTLTWDTEADLDLHVVDPGGGEIWARAPADAGGVLDGDSNAMCVIDGRRSESVTWAAAPPSGHYLVRVDLPWLCGAGFADWTVAVQLDGAQIAAAEGYSDESATRGVHDRGAGVLAVAFDVP